MPKNMIKLRLPLEHNYINQPFGANFVDFYQRLGMKGHNGIDFRAFTGCKVHACHDGVVSIANTDSTGGKEMRIFNKENKFVTVYYHLDSFCKEVGDEVKAGDVIAISDNTGLYTTGSHLHWGLKLTDDKGNSLNLNNGYYGAIDASQYFCYTFDGQEINPKDYDKSRCYHRYYRGRPKGGLVNEVKILAILGSKGIYPTAEKINALVYGGWDLNTVQNNSMYDIWSQLKKDEFINKGIKPFQI